MGNPSAFDKDNYQLTSRIHPWTTFCEGIPDIEKGYNYYRKLYKRNYFKLLPADKSSSILVLSAGVGYFVTFLNQLGYTNVLGLDSDETKVAYAQKKNINVILDDSFNAMQNKDDKYDLIIAEQEVNHLTKNELVALLINARNKLNPEGYFILNSTNYANFITSIDHLAHNFDHQSHYTENSLEQVFKYCGFKEVDCYPLDNYVFYTNPLNWVAKFITYLISLTHIVLYRLYGKSGKIFTKRLIGVGKI